MKIFKRIVRRKGLLKFIVFLIIAGIALIPAYFAASEIGVLPTCKVTTYQDFVKCSKTNKNVTFEIPSEVENDGVLEPSVFDLNYSFVEKGKMPQLFFDVNIGGYRAIMLVNEDVAKTLNDTEVTTKKFDARLVKYKGAELEAYKTIKQTIVEDLVNNGADEAEANMVFPLWQVKGYFETSVVAVIIAIAFTLIALASFIAALFGLKNVLFASFYKLDHKNRITKYYGIEKIATQFKEKDFAFKSAQVFVTDEAIIVDEMFTIFALQIKNLVWFYEDDIKKTFSTDHCVVLYTKDGKKEIVELERDECPVLLQVLRDKNDNAVVGYSRDLEAKWKKDYKSVVDRIL